MDPVPSSSRRHSLDRRRPRLKQRAIWWRRFHSKGHTVIKILPGLSRATFDTVVTEARRLHLRLAGHVPASVGLKDALTAGYHSVEHLDGYIEAMVREGSTASPAQSGFFGWGLIGEIDEARLAELVAATRASGAFVVPTEYEMELFVSMDSADALAREPGMRYVPRPMLQQWMGQKSNFARGAGVTPARSARYREIRRRVIRELHLAGVPIAVGSDAFNLFAVPGFATFQEMETLVAAGLTPRDALRSATTTVARLLGAEREIGSIAVGKAADLVLLEADPLADIRNVRRQAGVMLRGRWLSSTAIAERLAALAGL